MRAQKTPVASDRAVKHAKEKTTGTTACLPVFPRGSLASLSGEKPKTKAGQVQWLWPQIKCALRDGHKIRQIWECLAEGGLDLSYSRLRWYVARLKQMEAAGADLPRIEADQKRLPLAPDSTRGEMTRLRDPLSNLRDRLNRRPGFQFDERPPDENKLI